MVRAIMSAMMRKLAPYSAESGRSATIVRARDEAHGVRHDEADEADEAADGDRRGCRQGSEREDDQLHPLDIDAEMPRLLLVELHHVEDARVRQDDRGRDDHIGKGDAHIGPGGRVEAAQDPVEDRQRARVELEHEIRDDCRTYRRHGHAARISEVVGTTGPLRARKYASPRRSARPRTRPVEAARAVPAVTNSGEMMIRVAPTLAPAATPSRYGSASGLRKMPWYAAPQNASVAPDEAGEDDAWRADLPDDGVVGRRVLAGIDERQMVEQDREHRRGRDAHSAPADRDHNHDQRDGGRERVARRELRQVTRRGSSSCDGCRGEDAAPVRAASLLEPLRIDDFSELLERIDDARARPADDVGVDRMDPVVLDRGDRRPSPGAP